MSKVLLKYIPESALPLINKWYDEFHFHLRIAKSRKTKLGDFRPAFQGKPNRISVNGDLNQYHFLVTLTHEIAHVVCWEKYQSKVAPHGREWKMIYSEMLQALMTVVDFPSDVRSALQKHLKQPKASSCSDPELFKVLRSYNTNNAPHLICLEDISDDIEFRLHQRVFKKGKKRRTRFECIELTSKKTYLISGHAEVELLV